MVGLQSQLVLEQDDGSEFRRVVFDVETVWFTFDDSVASAYTDVVYPDLTFVSSTKLEFCLLWCHSEQMNVS